MRPFYIFFLSFLGLLFSSSLYAQTPAFNLDVESFLQPGGFSSSISLLIALSSISLLPFVLVSTTSFLRIVIVLSMLRQALQTQQSPPNMVIIGLAFFMTIFVMTPTFYDVHSQAITPYLKGEITQKEALEVGIQPFRVYMLKFVRDKDLALFMEFSRINLKEHKMHIPLNVLVPAYIISELKTAFQIAFLIFIPFLVIDLVISNILLSLGMFMLSPAMISLPFKILLFVLTDGWNLMVRGLLTSFQ
ncbi:MAG: flagellar type III secretion system pore protein FliP [bacterium]